MANNLLSESASATGEVTAQPNIKLSRRGAAGGGYNRIAPWLTFLAFALGLWYLWEAFLGKYPKPNGLWLSGATLADLAHKAIDAGAWWPVQWALENLVIPQAAFFAILVFALQVAVGLALTLGVCVRLSLVTGALMMSFITTMGFSQTPPLLLALGLLLLAAPPECFILDGALLKKAESLRRPWLRSAVRGLVTLGLESLVGKRGMTISRIFGAFAVCLALGSLNMPTAKMALATFELGVIGGIVAVGLRFGARRQPGQANAGGRGIGDGTVASCPW